MRILDQKIIPDIYFLQAARRILSGNLTQRQMIKLNEDLREQNQPICLHSHLIKIIANQQK